MGKRGWLAAAVAVAVLAGCGEGEKKAAAPGGAPGAGGALVIRWGTEGSNPPFTQYDPSGKVVGLDIDVAEEVCRRLEAKCEVVAQAWEGLIPGLQAGRYEAIIAGMSITEERKASVAFTRPYAPNLSGFVAPRGSALAQLPATPPRLDLDTVDAGEQAAIDGLRAALSGKSLGVLTATIHADYLEKALGDAVTVRRYETLDNVVLDLNAGRVDASFGDAVYWKAVLASEAGKPLAAFGPELGGGPLGPGLGIALRKDDTALLEKINGALEAMRQDGTIKRLSEARAGVDLTPP